MTGIPVHHDPTYDNRTIPAEPAPFPSRIAGEWVVAAALFPARTGEIPTLAVMVLRSTTLPVWHAYRTVIARHTNGEWSAGDGTDDCPYAEAMAVFMDRLGHRI